MTPQTTSLFHAFTRQPPPGTQYCEKDCLANNVYNAFERPSEVKPAIKEQLRRFQRASAEYKTGMPHEGVHAGTLEAHDLHQKF